jgi:hypothetical protein
MTVDKKLQLQVNATAAPNVTTSGLESEYYNMMIPTDVGTIFVDLSEEQVQEMHRCILMMIIGQVMSSGSLAYWHNRLDETIDELVQRYRDFDAMATRANRRMAHDQEQG